MARATELGRALSAWNPGDPTSLTWFLPELRALLGARFAGAYLPRVTDSGWSLEFMHGAGEHAVAHVATFTDFVAKLPASDSFLAIGNPHLVQPEQRNRVMSIRQINQVRPQGAPPPPFPKLFRALGISGHDQLRVVVCHGARQLAWVGATREEPFTSSEAAVLRRLGRPLRERLRLENQLAAPGLLSNALDAALEALPTAAFVIGPRATIEFVNRAGLALLERDRPGVLHGIRQSEVLPEQGPYFLTELGIPSFPRYVLAIRRESSGGLERVLLAQARWGLSARQARVLELITTGASNKEIASQLGCVESTIENHVTELFRRSGATSRAGLVGRLLNVS